MMSIEITAKGKKQLTKALQDACWEIADRIFSEAQTNLAVRTWITEGSNGPYSSVITDTGELLGSGTIERTKTGAHIEFESEHATSVEYGLPEGTSVPVEPLIKWARRKIGMSEKEAENAAWAIHTKIYQQGIEARPFLREAIYKIVAEYYAKKVRV